VQLDAGDLFLLRVRRDGLERALFRDYDRLHRAGRNQPLPGGQNQDWMVTAHQHYLRPPAHRSLQMLLSVEKDAGRTPQGAVLAQVKPRFVWFDLRAGDGKEQPKGVRWRNVGNVLGYPAPTWRLDVDKWPRNALAHVSAWVREQGVTGPNLSLRLTHNRGDPVEAMVPSPEQQIGADPVHDLHVTAEEMDVEVGPGDVEDIRPGGLVHKYCLVVRAEHAPHRPLLAQLRGLPGPVSSEHRYYTGKGGRVNYYTGVFWPLTRAEAEKASFQVLLTSVAAVQDDPGTYKIPFDIGIEDKDLRFQATNGPGIKSFGTIEIQLVPPPPATQAPPPKPSIEGTVVDGAGRGQPKLQVTLTDAQNVVRDTQTTDASGNFVFKNVPPGAYRVSSRKTANNTSGSTAVEVAEGEKKTGVEIKLGLR
jgi:hypothetical protein